MTIQEMFDQAKKDIGPHCSVCKVCNGKACSGKIPGPGGKGSGAGFWHSYDRLRQVRLNMNVLYNKEKEPDTKIELFGKTFDYPFFVAPVGGVQLHYSDKYNDLSYSEAIIEGCIASNTIGFTGDGTDDLVFEGTIKAIKKSHGHGIPTIKPWADELILKKIAMAEEAGALALAMDIDAGGLAFLAAKGKPVSPKSLDALKNIIGQTKLPFIIKGIMTVEAALKAVEAGAAGIVVSNHGGRVLDETPATIDVLEDIVDAVNGKLKIFIDGGFRSGLDVIKALALGADGVLIARPYAIAVYGGGAEGVNLYTQTIGQEMKDTMTMMGIGSISDISRKHVTRT